MLHRLEGTKQHEHQPMKQLFGGAPIKLRQRFVTVQSRYISRVLIDNSVPLNKILSILTTLDISSFGHSWLPWASLLHRSSATLSAGLSPSFLWWSTFSVYGGWCSNSVAGGGVASRGCHRRRVVNNIIWPEFSNSAAHQQSLEAVILQKQEIMLGQ